MRRNRLRPPATATRGRVWRRVLVAAGVVAGVVVLLMVLAGSAEAVPPVQIATSPEQVLDNLRNWLTGILGLVATVCLTFAGIRYVIASGDPGEIEKAKGALRAACLGYVLAMLAPLIVAVLKTFVAA
ncbi:pilin [Nocardia macrotermitis]|uniref:TrbC/VIRB2 family protein n=1 Tax=Nocardia macrotermitis TaxID=2585198 RepID=A0A7K0DBB9_9NOCA|nr:pilin [Nocardia macrotermitis]MQY23027.1 hypothetical protein [Nocardia macrotermitis]